MKSLSINCVSFLVAVNEINLLVTYGSKTNIVYSYFYEFHDKNHSKIPFQYYFIIHCIDVASKIRSLGHQTPSKEITS